MDEGSLLLASSGSDNENSDQHNDTVFNYDAENAVEMAKVVPKLCCQFMIGFTP